MHTQLISALQGRVMVIPTIYEKLRLGQEGHRPRSGQAVAQTRVSGHPDQGSFRSLNGISFNKCLLPSDSMPGTVLGSRDSGQQNRLLQANLSAFHASEPNPRDFPGGPVAKTPHSQFRGPRFHPWSGNYIPHATTQISCHS